MYAPLTLALALALTPAQPASPIKLTNVRNTYGELGGTRSASKLLPGDVLFVGFDIEGITIDPEGKVAYTMALEVADKAGKLIFKQNPVVRADVAPLGGNTIQGRAFITVGLDQAPGKYNLKVTVADPVKKANQTLTHEFEVLPKGFGIVAVYASADDRGQIPAPTTGIIGQSLFVQFSVVGFSRSPDTRQPDVQVEMLPLDATGRPTIEKASEFTLQGGVDEKDPSFALRFLLPLTRTGKYTVRLKATDKIAKQTATFDLPIAVVPSAN
ncbi:MAG: hypothetical protein LC104_02380 [Bacteroidales bacterium]|nr:hypothetical protein [Bacteroidales bacterium]